MNNMLRVPLLIIIVALGVLSCTNNKPTDSERIIPSDSLVVHTLCDSMYYPDYLDIRENLKDTIINQAQYVLCLPPASASGNVLAFRKSDSTYFGVQYMDGIIDGKTIKFSKDDDPEEANYYYSDFKVSRSEKYIFLLSYYTTLDIVTEKEILKLGNGSIFDLQKGEFITCWTGFSEIAGDWNYCDQWVADGVVVFDPNEQD